MSLDHIQLPAFLYESLFGNNLIDLKKERKSILIQKKEVNYLGKNKKKIIFLYNDDHNKFLPANQMKFLYDLFAACQLTMDDIALINVFNNHPITYRDLIIELHPKKILIFGTVANNIDLPFSIPFFQIQNFQDQVYVISPSITELLITTEFRKQLWACLQKVFNIEKHK